MKKLPFITLLVLSACGGPDKFRYPVVVTADKAPIFENTDIEADKITEAMRGDTLELRGMEPGDRQLCRVAPKPGRDRFPGSNTFGYIERRYLQIPDSTLAAAKKEGFPHLDRAVDTAPAATDWRGKN